MFSPTTDLNKDELKQIKMGRFFLQKPEIYSGPIVDSLLTVKKGFSTFISHARGKSISVKPSIIFVNWWLLSTFYCYSCYTKCNISQGNLWISSFDIFFTICNRRKKWKCFKKKALKLEYDIFIIWLYIWCDFATYIPGGYKLHGKRFFLICWLNHS